MKNANPAATELVDWLGALLREAGHCEPNLVLVQEARNPSSTHWVIESRQGTSGSRYFVKKHARQELYRQERDALTLLQDFASPTEPYAVPKLIASDDDMSCIVLQWIEGESIAEPVRAAVSRFASHAAFETGLELTHRVGIWLRRLRDRTSRAADELDRGRFTTRFDELLEIITSSGTSFLRRSTVDRLVEFFRRALDLARPEGSCLVHKDFWFDHIWTCGHQVIVLDFGRARVRPAGRDAVQFYCRLADLASMNPLVSASRCRRLVSAFVDGYGGLSLCSPMNRVWEMLTRAEQLAGLVDNSGNLSVTLRIQQYVLARRLNALASNAGQPDRLHHGQS